MLRKTTDKEYEIAAKFWKRMYTSNFYSRSLEAQRKFKDGIMKELKEIGFEIE